MSERLSLRNCSVSVPVSETEVRYRGGSSPKRLGCVADGGSRVKPRGMEGGENRLISLIISSGARPKSLFWRCLLILVYFK